MDFLASLGRDLQAFTAERGWTPYHTPKNLAMALAGEAGELVAEFQWLTAEESAAGSLSVDKRLAVESEMADVLIYLVQLARVLDTDLAAAVERKMADNARRFPVGDGTSGVGGS